MLRCALPEVVCSDVPFFSSQNPLSISEMLLEVRQNTDHHILVSVAVGSNA